MKKRYLPVLVLLLLSLFLGCGNQLRKPLHLSSKFVEENHMPNASEAAALPGALNGNGRLNLAGVPGITPTPTVYSNPNRAKSASKRIKSYSTGEEQNQSSSGHELTLEELRRKYKSTLFFKGSPRWRAVALTFDDAPDPRFTPQILDELQRNHVKATFFLVGKRAEKYPTLVRRIAARGHVIGNHSYTHPNFNKLSESAFRREVLKTNRVLQPLIGYDPKLLRPPYGNIRENELVWLANNGFKVINWSSDSLDWKGLKADEIIANIMKNVEPGAIILQHAGGGTGEDLSETIKAIPRVVKKLRDRGYDIVTVPELLDLPKSR
ncbi:polysaccharide deacetylase family protein [Gorillibacterium massiliense]|uniref:polysaccharide deacetylase family protein n=1 Tax=Gorillibacterium massiliense TaxID=1280390 RepID=UPI0004B7C6EE|nr:polysaccharide deacetylase family protein [Gorillibacterium massiliense]